MRYQNSQERIKNFLEVALGYSKKEAVKEAARCLQCPNPQCVKGCPVEIDIPAFIQFIKEGKPQEALKKIKERNNLPAVCGRVCPQEDQCEARCILGNKETAINIGALERYAADNGKSQVISYKSQVEEKKLSAIKVAVVGSGPAGLTTAADLAKIYYSVTLFESLQTPGGVLIYGIPEFRLPKKVVREEADYIKSLGVDIVVDTLIGQTFTLHQLFEKGYRAIFLGIGAGLPRFLGIPGENLGGVYSANEFLTRVNLMQAYKFPEYATPVNIDKQVIVIGGGNVALDSARCALRMGSEVRVIYRRSEAQMPARAEELKRAKEEGVIFNFLTQPLKIIDDTQGRVRAVECVKMRLGEADISGREKPVEISGSNFILNAGTLIVAAGQTPNPLLNKLNPQIKVNPNGTICADENFMTSIPGVFAGGDIITGSDTVIAAMGAGKKAALAMDRYVKKYILCNLNDQ